MQTMNLMIQKQFENDFFSDNDPDNSRIMSRAYKTESIPKAG